MNEQNAFDAARKGRLLLRDALCNLQEAIETPIGTGSRWYDRVATALGELSAAIGAHSADVESDDGLFAVVVRQAPRLSGIADHIRKGHHSLRADVDALLATLASPGAIAGDPEEIRASASEIIDRVARLRQKSADMVYDAFAVEIGGPA